MHAIYHIQQKRINLAILMNMVGHDEYPIYVHRGKTETGNQSSNLSQALASCFGCSCFVEVLFCTHRC